MSLQVEVESLIGDYFSFKRKVITSGRQMKGPWQISVVPLYSFNSWTSETDICATLHSRTKDTLFCPWEIRIC